MSEDNNIRSLENALCSQIFFTIYFKCIEYDSFEILILFQKAVAIKQVDT